MISDRIVEHPLVARKTIYEGMVWDIRHDTFEFNGKVIERDYVVHPGAVAIIAINDNAEMLLIEQYRHAHSKIMWEAPAGLLDAKDESPLAAAKRELHEETGYEAAIWNVLVDFANSPGGSTEQFRIFLAQGLTMHADGRPIGDDEELNMPMHWIPVQDVVESIARGAVTNPQLVLGTYAALMAMADPDMVVRSADAPWHAREDVLESDRVRLPKN